MPKVMAPARAMQSGEMVTQFTDTASTTATTFTYPNSQEGLTVVNKGVTAITLTVSGQSYTVQPGQNQTVSTEVSSFTVQSASGTQQFDASAWSYEKDKMQLTGSNGQKLDSEHNGFMIRNVPPAVPFPPRLTDAVLLEPAQHLWYLPKWMDKNGVMWGSHAGNGLYKSADYGETWIRVLTAPDADNPTALIMSDTGRAIWCTDTGKVYVSDTSLTTWTLAFTFPAGYTSVNYGHSKYKNIILLCSYGPKSTTNSPRFVYASFDNGDTFSKIYEGVSRDGYHVHHAVYDPWADRILVSEGDTLARQISYSDNRGLTWTKVWPNSIGRIQPTVIVPTPYGIVFGGDSEPDGLQYWPRPKGVIKPPIKAEDIIDHLYLDEVTDVIRHVTRRPWYNMEVPDNQFVLIGAGCDTSTTEGYPRILASGNGLDFHEIWKHPTSGDSGVQYITGPHPHDPQRRFFATVNIGGTLKLLKGRLPLFSNTDQKRKDPITSTKLLDGFSIAPSSSKAVIVNLANADSLQVFISCDKNYDLSFYPMFQESDADGLMNVAEALATNGVATAAGRTAMYKPTKLPALYGRFSIVNKDTTNPALVSLWMVAVNKS